MVLLDLGLSGDETSSLEIFRLWNHPQYNGAIDQEFYATVNTLQELAFQERSAIKTLELHFQRKAFDELPPLPAYKSTHPLQELYVGTGSSYTLSSYSLQHKARIAMLLDSLFPSLAVVKGTACGFWNDINTLVKTFQEFRMFHKVSDDSDLS